MEHHALPGIGGVALKPTSLHAFVVAHAEALLAAAAALPLTPAGVGGEHSEE